MATHRLFILALAALPFVTVGAAAQELGRYASWDRNNDGVITRAEWRGTVQQFRELDWNDDGVLTSSEIRERAPEQWDGRSFVSLDRNRDGWISQGEWTGDRATFRRIDRNGDNHLSRGEFMNANVADDFETTDFDELDYDNSGRIERDEWTGTRGSFNRLDTNRDGMITRREYALSDVTRADVDEGVDEFDRLDYNNNGVISRNEWRGNDISFNQRDANRDGVLTRSEYTMTRGGGDATVVREAVGVSARDAWTNTGLYVNAGDVIIYRATGSIQMSSDGNDRASPGGSITGRKAIHSPRSDRPAGLLLARVGGGPVEALGVDGSFTAQNSGELQLGINDDHFADNSGGYNVALTIRQR